MGARIAYNKGSNARKLNIETEHPFEVTVGGGRSPEIHTASDAVILFAKFVIIGILAFALIGIVRISLSSATVALALETKQIDAQIDEARDIGGQLEVEQSMLSNPTRIKTEAASIGMAVPATTTFMDLSGDVVVYDEAGTLSISGSISEMATQVTAAQEEAAAIAAQQQAERDAAFAAAEAKAQEEASIREQHVSEHLARMQQSNSGASSSSTNIQGAILDTPQVSQ